MDRFEPDRGSAFVAFAIPVILGEVKNYFRDHGWAVKVPRKLQKHRMIVEKAVDSLGQADGHAPTITEIATATGLSEDQVYDTLEVGRYGNPVSLEAEYDQNGSENGSSVLEFLGSDDPQLSGLPDKIDLLNTLRKLDQRERTIIRLKFYAGLSQTEIAKRLRISQMHVSRLQRNALVKIRGSLGGTES
jgi:RNA polymerase sigma-B factor